MDSRQRNIGEVPTATEIAGAVTAQHGMIRAAFHAAKTGSDATKQDATRHLLQLLAMHEAAEQLTVHPALLRAGGGVVGVGEDRMEEEQQATQLVERLQGFEYGTYEHNMQFALLEEAVTHHAEAEERSELPLFGELDETERLTIAQALGAVARAVEEDELVAYGPFSTMVSAATSWLAR